MGKKDGEVVAHVGPSLPSVLQEGRVASAARRTNLRFGPQGVELPPRSATNGEVSEAGGGGEGPGARWREMEGERWRGIRIRDGGWEDEG